MSLTSGSNAIDALVYSSWNRTADTPVTLTYSFLTRAPIGASADDRTGFKAMSSVQQSAVRDALGEWASVANISFVEVASSTAQLQFGTNTQGTSTSAYAYLPGIGIPSVQMYLNNKLSYNSDFSVGSYGPSVVLHEIGHMLGLKHPGDYNATGSDVDGPFLPAATDNGDYTLMSYNDPTGYAINHKFQTTLMMYDIQAIQYLYGANTRYHSGNDEYDFSSGTAPMCLWDAGGTDTLDFSACTGATVINLNAGAFSETARGLNNVSIAYGVTIENAIGGAGGTTFYANGAGNRLTGGAAADTFHLGAGSDTITGAGGQDTVVFAKNFASYTVVRDGNTLTVTGEGTDLLSGIESLRFADRTLGIDAFSATTSQVGTAGNDTITAVPTAVRIDGAAGLDTVLFGGARGTYDVNAVAEGYSITAKTSGVTDVLVNVERLQFADGNIALDVGGTAGQLYRLYAAAFDRTPDESGIGFWLKAMDGGAQLSGIAEHFANSPEFVGRYGALDNAGYLTQLYANVLDRQYDQEGFNFWLGALEGGVPRGDILTGFSESTEFRATLAGGISDGVDYLPFGG